MSEQLFQTHNRVLFDQYKQLGPVRLGPYSSYTWRNDPKHVLFTMARYKFCAKVLAGRTYILEVGCGDALGAPLLLQTVHKLHCLDLEPLVIADARERNNIPDRLTFEAHDITVGSIAGSFDGAVSLDVIEHIPQKLENDFLANICAALQSQAICIIGTPNVTAQQFASKNSAEGHINLKSAEALHALMLAFFHNVTVLGMNDEVVHTGFYPMAHYLMAIGYGVRSNSNSRK